MWRESQDRFLHPNDLLLESWWKRWNQPEACLPDVGNKHTGKAMQERDTLAQQGSESCLKWRRDRVKVSEQRGWQQEMKLEMEGRSHWGTIRSIDSLPLPADSFENRLKIIHQKVVSVLTCTVCHVSTWFFFYISQYSNYFHSMYIVSGIISNPGCV